MKRAVVSNYCQSKKCVPFVSRRSFSQFQNYDDACSSYDRTRKAVGIDKIKDTFQMMHLQNYKPVLSYLNYNAIADVYTFENFLSEFRVLDAGCGTGNYMKQMFDLGVGSVNGMDYSAGMLTQTVKKFNNMQLNVMNSQSIKLYEGDLTQSFPFKANSFDAILLNQVLHHVVSNNESDISKKMETVLKQCCDVLNDKGAVIITTSTPDQLKWGYWFAQFFPTAVNKMCQKHVDLAEWYKILENSGFNEIHNHQITEFHASSDYLHVEGLLDPEWRKCDSLFSLVTDDELENAKQKLNKILENKKIKKQFLEQCEESRKSVGHSVALVAFKN